MPRRSEPRLRSRGTDRAETVIAGLLTAVAAVGLLLALAAGAGAHADVADRGRAEARTRVPTTATLTGDAPMMVMADGPGAHALHTAAPAAWTAPDGAAREGLVPVAAGSREGRTLRIWTERDGTLAEPPSRSEVVALVAAVTTGGGIALLVGAAVAGAWWATRRVTAVLNSRAWEREWAAIEWQWRRNPR